MDIISHILRGRVKTSSPEFGGIGGTIQPITNSWGCCNQKVVICEYVYLYRRILAHGKQMPRKWEQAYTFRRESEIKFYGIQAMKHERNICLS